MRYLDAAGQEVNEGDRVWAKRSSYSSNYVGRIVRLTAKSAYVSNEAMPSAEPEIFHRDSIVKIWEQSNDDN